MDIAQIFTNHHAEIFRYLFIRTGSVETAEDLSSEVFLKLVKEQAKYDPMRSGVRTWLYLLARNLLADHFSRAKHQQPLELQDFTDLAVQGDAAEFVQDWLYIINLLRDLSPEDQELIVLRYVNDLSIRDISRIKNKSYISTKVATHRALKKLKQLANE